MPANDSPVFRLDEFPIHLGLGATAVRQTRFSGIEWYQQYGERHGGDGIEGPLVSMHGFSRSWDSWEMHPSGAELVVCTQGRITLHQELEAGSLPYGWGTETRPR